MPPSPSTPSPERGAIRELQDRMKYHRDMDQTYIDCVKLDALDALMQENATLRTRLEEAEKDGKRLEQLQSMILPDDPLHEGDVTLNAFTYACNEGMPDEFRAPCVQIYLGEHPIPTGIGDTLRAAIDHAATPSKEEQDHE